MENPSPKPAASWGSPLNILQESTLPAPVYLPFPRGNTLYASIKTEELRAELCRAQSMALIML